MERLTLTGRGQRPVQHVNIGPVFIMDAFQPAVLAAANSLALRYGAQAAPDAGPWNEHIALLLSHRSIRGYRSDGLPAGTLRC